MAAPSVTTTDVIEARPARPGLGRPEPDRSRSLRRRLCYATVLACLPYLGLKVAWVLGAQAGVSSSGFTDTSRVANVLTAALQLVAIGLAVLFVLPVGRRLPAFVMAFPTWVATGLLLPVAVGAVGGSAVQLVTGGGNAFTDDGGLAGWVFALVYGGFALQAVLLIGGFVLYARDRWPVATRGGRAVDGAGTTRSLQNLLGVVFIAAAAAFAGLQVGWAVHGGGGFTHPTTAQGVFLLAGAISAVLGIAGTARLLRGSRLSRTLLVLVWVGSSVTFMQALLNALKNAAVGPEGWGAVSLTPGDATALLFVLLGALGGAVGGATRLVEEERQ